MRMCMSHKSLLNRESGIDGEEPALEGVGAGIVCLNFWQVLEVFADAVQEGNFLVLLRVDPLDVVRIFSDDEVRQSEISQNEGLLAHRSLQLLKLGKVFLDDTHLGSLVVLVEEESPDGASNLVENRKEGFNSRLVLGVLSEKFLLSPSVDDVTLDGGGLSELVFSIDEVWQIGEAEPEVHLVVLEPVLAIGVLLVLERHARVRKEQSGNLSEAANPPISKLDLPVFWLVRHGGRQEWLDKRIRSVIVSPNSGKLFEVVSDSEEEAIVLPEFGESVLNIVQSFSDDEVSKSDVSEGEGPVSHEILEVVQLGNNLLVNFILLFRGGIGSPKRSKLLEHIIKHAENVLDVSFILGSLSQKFIVAGTANDVLQDGRGLCQFEVSVDEVGQVGELQSEVLLVLLKPLLPALVLHLAEGGVSVGEEKADGLGQAADFPVAKSYAGHQKICIQRGVILIDLRQQRQKFQNQNKVYFLTEHRIIEKRQKPSCFRWGTSNHQDNNVLIHRQLIKAVSYMFQQFL